MANMEGALLRRQYFIIQKGTRMDKHHIDGADLSAAIGLTPEHLESAVIDDTTKLPEHLEYLREEVKNQTEGKH